MTQAVLTPGSLKAVEFQPKMPPMTSTLGKIIKERLAHMRKTQEWLAEQAGVSTAAVSKWIRNGKISRESVVKVAEALDLTTDQLMDLHPIGATRPAPTVANDTTLERLDVEEKRILELYRRSTKDGKLMILGAATVAPKEGYPYTSSGKPN